MNRDYRFLVLTLAWSLAWGHESRDLSNYLVDLSYQTNVNLVKFAIKRSAHECVDYGEAFDYVDELVYKFSKAEASGERP